MSNEKTPPLTGAAVSAGKSTKSVSSNADISAFLQTANKTKTNSDGRSGGLIFALDATMSRQHTWDAALQIQAEMFNEVDKIGGLYVQLVYFRGFGECRASRWVNGAKDLRNLMTGIGCRGGQTQIGKILKHGRKEVGRKSKAKVNALVFVGDAMEENPDALCQVAGELGVLSVPVFMFQEGHDTGTEQVFREISRLSGGAYMKFGQGSAAQLAQLLKAVARYAAGGRAALARDGSRVDQLLLEQVR